MTDDRLILICSSCTKPSRLLIVDTGAEAVSVKCPYCDTANISEVPGAVRAETLEQGEQTFFWDANRRQKALTGRADSD